MVLIISSRLFISISEFCSKTPNNPGIASITLVINEDAASSKGGRTWSIIPGNSSAITGAICPTRSPIPRIACVNAGKILVNAVFALSTTLLISSPKSAFLSASPNIRLSQAADKAPAEPEIVSAASAAVVPVIPISVCTTWIA